MVKRYGKHLILTFGIMLVVVFISGLILGKYLERYEGENLANLLKENELNTESFLLEQELIKSSGEKGCELAKNRIDEMSEQLGSIGRRLSTEDIDKILGEKDFNHLKRTYHLMQLRTFFMYRQLEDRCNLEKDIVLFYYGSDNGASSAQGKILDQLVEEMDTIVFAVEYNYTDELNFVEYYYNVTKTPTLIINFNTTYHGLVEYDQLKSTMIKT